MTSFGLEPIYGSLLVAVVVGVAAVVVILTVTPPTKNPVHRRWLITLRLVAAAVLLLVLFRPALIRTDNRPAEAALVVAVDTSRSMTLPDGDGSTRWASQVNAWKQLAPALRGLDQSLAVRLLAYDASARSLPAVVGDALEGEIPDGELTDLSAAAMAAIQAAQGQPIAGVVLMGDGTQTAPLQGTGAQRVVETLNSLGVPLWTVPIGPAGGDSASRDVAVNALQESYRLFAGNQVDVEFQLTARGVTGVEIPVRLSWVDTDGEETEIAVRRIVPTKSAELVPMAVTVVAPDPGAYRLKVAAETQEGELVTTNNLQVAFADVREGGGRILYLEGALREEQMFLNRSLRRFPDLDLTFRPILRDTSDSWPVDLADSFRPGKFDIYVIGDLDARAIGDAQLSELAAAVSQGAGLLMLGGYQTYGAGGYATSPLAEVIPIRMDSDRRRNLNTPIDDDAGQLPGPVTIELARNHPITDLGGDNPEGLWQQLPKLTGANRFLDPKIAPGVMVLLETPEENPLLVVGEYGSGRTAALAIDSTYRWWRAGNKDAHRRFWRQLILWLLAREDSSGEKINIDIDARRFTTNDPPDFRASVQLLGETARPYELVAEVVDQSGEVKPITVTNRDRGDAGDLSAQITITGTLPELAPGFYRLRVRPSVETTALPAEEMAFQVVDESRELARPMADPVYLRQLADLTSGHGGGAFPPDQMDALIDVIKDRRRQAETPVLEKFRLGDDPISGWVLFALFAVALSTEWFLRRQWGLA